MYVPHHYVFTQLTLAGYLLLPMHATDSGRFFYTLRINFPPHSKTPIHILQRTHSKVVNGSYSYFKLRTTGEACPRTDLPSYDIYEETNKGDVCKTPMCRMPTIKLVFRLKLNNVLAYEETL
jgi:hypothetical protein